MNQPVPHNCTLSWQTNWEEINLHLNPSSTNQVGSTYRSTGRPERLIDDKKGVCDEKWTVKNFKFTRIHIGNILEGWFSYMNSLGESGGHFE